MFFRVILFKLLLMMGGADAWAQSSSAAIPGTIFEMVTGTFSKPVQPRATVFPVILAHGLLASDTLFSLRNLAATLRENGTTVFVAEVSAAASVQYRATQLTREVIRVLQVTGAAKVNIIAHSMGGLDARYLIVKSGIGAHVASLTTLSTPHRGTAAADETWRNLETGNYGILVTLINGIASTYNGATRFRTADLRAAVEDLTTWKTKQFNQEIQDREGTLYQSVSASADDYNEWNGIHLLLKPSHTTVLAAEGPNDGLVSVRSSTWGHHLGSARADHFTVAGQGRWGVATYDATGMIKWIIDDLANRGY